MQFKNFISTKWPLILILIIATTLRLWNLFEIPLTHDEVSALNRTQFDNFADLITYGVKADTHPPGVQVFLYYWTKLFGYEQWIVKLPFILMGLGSLIIAYSIFRRWSNETVALIIIAYMATMQFTVMYSQIARPYISGMFLILCLVYFWNELVCHPATGFWKNMTLSILFGAACAYNHHFSLLAAVIIGITGIFVIDKKYLFKYFILGIGIFLLYVPNLSIFFYQLDRGGVGEWLGAPTSKFFLNFFRYIFNHSVSLVISFIIILAIGIYQVDKFQFKKWGIISGIWFFSVLLIGYYYSIYRNPVLQISMLIFFFPFLMNFLLGWIPKMSSIVQNLGVVLVLFAGTMSITISRKHYEVFYTNRYYQMKVDASNCDQSNTCFIFANYPHFLNIDFPKDIILPLNYLSWENNVNTLLEAEEYISKCGHEKLFLGHVEQFPKELITVVRNHYPFLEDVHYYSGASSYLFSKSSKNEKQLSYFEFDVLKKPSKGFEPLKLFPNGYKDSNEWSIGANIELSGQIEHKYDLLNITAKVKKSQIDQEIILVAEFPNNNGDEPIYWGGSSSNKFLQMPDSSVLITLTISIDLIKTSFDHLPKLSTFIWNLNKKPITVESYKVELLEGNRNKFALWERIE